MEELNEGSGQYIRSYGELTPERMQALWDEAVEFMNGFYANTFNLDQYMPVVKDGYEDKLNKIQFYIQMMVLQGPQEFSRAVMFGTQAAFWLGYLEGKESANDVSHNDALKVFKDALGE